MQRHFRAEFADDPLRERPDFLRRIVLAGNQQGGDFQPARGFVANLAEPVKHRLQTATAQANIKIVRKCLEVDIGRVKHGKKFTGRRAVHVGSGDSDSLDPMLTAGNGRINRIFGKDHRIVVGEGDRLCAVGQCRRGDTFRAGGVHLAVQIA